MQIHSRGASIQHERELWTGQNRENNRKERNKQRRTKKRKKDSKKVSERQGKEENKKGKGKGHLVSASLITGKQECTPAVLTSRNPLPSKHLLGQGCSEEYECSYIASAYLCYYRPKLQSFQPGQTRPNSPQHFRLVTPNLLSRALLRSLWAHIPYPD